MLFFMIILLVVMFKKTLKKCFLSHLPKYCLPISPFKCSLCCHILNVVYTQAVPLSWPVQLVTLAAPRTEGALEGVCKGWHGYQGVNGEHRATRNISAARGLSSSYPEVIMVMCSPEIKIRA